LDFKEVLFDFRNTSDEIGMYGSFLRMSLENYHGRGVDSDGPDQAYQNNILS
jgi:hypothetical protein